ncbi:MAG: GTPase ObgE [Bacilli bacterium]|jgi:GTP-binding protein|nr:GTPase ObgE [Bacilli bacterium]
MFIDEVIVELKAGDGGDGCMAFRREKYVEMGGPAGGNGGTGGSIIFEVDEGLNTLIDLRYRKLIKAKKGENGQGKGMHGKGASDEIVRVPMGTVITDLETGLILADLTKHKEQAVIATGGRGGRGNIAFATRANPAPSYSEHGEEGEHLKIKAELKLLADVGLVGLPSVGKSTLISKISASKPKIAAYHFTTLKPNLGVVRVDEGKSFVVADLPGLIKGASLGEGLGDRFLKHIERTRVIAHILDMSGSEGRDPLEDYKIINHELEAFNPKMMDKPQVVIANKMDLDGAKQNLQRFHETYPDVTVFEVSALQAEGLQPVIRALSEMLEHIAKQPLYEEEKFASHVLYKFKKEQPFRIIKDNAVWVIKGDEIEKIFKMTKFTTEEAFLRFSRKLRKLGIDDRLKELGALDGDTVRILDYEFEYRQ